jgi:hypothetical protein
VVHIINKRVHGAFANMPGIKSDSTDADHYSAQAHQLRRRQCKQRLKHPLLSWDNFAARTGSLQIGAVARHLCATNLPSCKRVWAYGTEVPAASHRLLAIADERSSHKVGDVWVWRVASFRVDLTKMTLAVL